MKFLLGLLTGIVLMLMAYGVSQLLVSQSAPEQNDSPELLDVFRFTLEDEVVKQGAVPEVGFTPQLLLESFPGLVESDFRGVTAGDGVYTIENGVLLFVRDESGLVPVTSGGLNRAGYGTLLQNTAARLEVDLTTNGTITDVMTAIAKPRS